MMKNYKRKKKRRVIMPRDYQPKKYESYRLPHNVYMIALYIIRDYDRLKEEYENDIAYKPPDLDGTPGGKGTTRPVESIALSLLNRHNQLHAIDTALALVPDMYRRGILANITRRRPYPPYTAVRTYSRHKQRFIYFVAKNLNLV